MRLVKFINSDLRFIRNALHFTLKWHIEYNSEKYDIFNRWKDKDKKKSIQFSKKLNDIDYFRKWKQQPDNSGGFAFWTI